MHSELARVAFVINDLKHGGAQVAVLELAKRLRDTYNVCVYYFHSEAAANETIEPLFEQAGITCIRLGRVRGVASLASCARLYRELRTFNPSVLHCHLPNASICGVIVGNMLRVPKIVMHEHNTHGLFSRKLQWTLTIVRHFVDMTICFSPVVEEELFGASHELSTPPETLTSRTITIRNGADVSAIEAARRVRSETRASLEVPENAVCIISVARLLPWKGQRELLDAFMDLAPQYPEVYLVLVGDGPLRDDISKKVHDSRYGSRVRMLGSRSDVYPLLAASDVGVLALVYEQAMVGESIGLAGAEMMAAGLAFVASDYPAAHTLITPGRNGVLVTPGDVSELRRALAHLVEDPEFRNKLGTEAHKTARARLSWDSLASIYKRVYTLLITA